MLAGGVSVGSEEASNFRGALRPNTDGTDLVASQGWVDLRRREVR